MLPADPRERERDQLRAAFRDVHGARLHGFALLVSLGDRHRAAMAAGSALADGLRRAEELRHPERAAALLRRHVIEELGRGSSRRGPSAEARRAALAALGADRAAFDGLAILSPRERAALVASSLEGFDPIDLETILRASAAEARDLLHRARQRYLAAATGAPDSDAAGAGWQPGRAGEITARIDRLASQTMGAGGRS